MVDVDATDRTVRASARSEKGDAGVAGDPFGHGEIDGNPKKSLEEGWVERSIFE
jgi:hypothetical protein